MEKVCGHLKFNLFAMKIDKVIFTMSEQYSPFWNIVSRVYKTYLNIEPVGFFFGKKTNTDINEDYGIVNEISFDLNFPKLIQLTWFKFWYTSQEPDITWLIGDIDMLPLQRFWFTENIKDVPEDFYIHLNPTICALLIGKDPSTWELHGSYTQGGADLCGHYHVAKGSIFKKALNLNNNFLDDIHLITKDHKYGLGNLVSHWPKTEDKLLWCAEENYSSEVLFQNVKKGAISYQGFSFDHSHYKIDKHYFQENTSTYNCSQERLAKNNYIDIHCSSPYSKQESALINVLKWANIIQN